MEQSEKNCDLRFSRTVYMPYLQGGNISFVAHDTVLYYVWELIPLVGILHTALLKLVTLLQEVTHSLTVFKEWSLVGQSISFSRTRETGPARRRRWSTAAIRCVSRMMCDYGNQRPNLVIRLKIDEFDL